MTFMMIQSNQVQFYSTWVPSKEAVHQKSYQAVFKKTGYNEF